MRPPLAQGRPSFRTVSVYAFEVASDRFKRIWAVRNPGKLRPWTAGRLPLLLTRAAISSPSRSPTGSCRSHRLNATT